ncbi:PAS and helix-turn-helix domain-containing protein [Pseudothioclava arenosa]|uniref:Helix-turn-helix transcriptional regulator n=1 Tax=Pseudothioclava arenosa TaxID=1795308 RepID=A0A2A4CSX5_9RHOB|nr:PAS and helix-turn-helix domain-containing protein [Pseudothioclava arenosa]PCD77388.1 helix-turn-helix transcriptional regulator [Pseudothioclava arenosa]
MHRDDEASTAFEFAPIGLVLSHRRVVVRCNAQMCQMFGYTRAELEGQSLSRLYPTHEEFDRIGAIGLERMRRENFYVDERIMKRHDETQFWCRVRGQSLTPENPFEQAIWSFADISAARPIVNLTRRERQIAMHMAEGLTSKEIARLLGISHRTVEAHRARLHAKLDARNTAECIARITGLPQ